MKILLLGSNGMLGQSVSRYFATLDKFELYTAARTGADFNFDFTNFEMLEECFAGIRPDICINAAAIVSLDDCEKNVGVAYSVNAAICSNLADLCARYQTYYIQISTDHYYSGDGRRKHTEKDAIHLYNEYARTKYAGECFAGLYENALVLRTNIVGFRGDAKRPTFVEWALNTLHSKQKMRLFNDFFTSSISTILFVKILRDVIDARLTGLYNLASGTVSSKEEFILNLSQQVLNYVPKYDSVSVAEGLHTRRAESLGLDTSKIEQALGYSMPQLDEVVHSIAKEYKELYAL